jgi:hypothetical protein
MIPTPVPGLWPDIVRPAGEELMLERLEPFVGEWTIEAAFRDAPPTGRAGRAVFEWALGRAFLVERTEIPHPDAPDGLCVIAADAQGGTYTQHYFDSRGVVRVYVMTFDGRVWTLERTKPDFTPLNFAQRYVGTFSDDGSIIDGRWEIAHDGQDWELDFGLTYVRVE